MKFFGRELVTKKDLKITVSNLENELRHMKEAFPFELGQVVYDIQLRNETGKYTRSSASLEHSRINEVEVTKKNYFGLVDRYKNNDVFFELQEANDYLMRVCVKKV